MFWVGVFFSHLWFHHVIPLSVHAWKTTPITFICVLMLSSRTNRLCSQTNLPQKSPLASNPTSDRLWCCHLVGSPSKKTERSQRKGERRERREGEKEKQMICHDWSDACEEETPAAQLMCHSDMKTYWIKLNIQTWCLQQDVRDGGWW